jgi:hypothetical protein
MYVAVCLRLILWEALIMRSSSAGERRVGLICGRGAFVMVSRQLNRWSVPVSRLCLGLLECTWAEAGTLRRIVSIFFAKSHIYLSREA